MALKSTIPAMNAERQVVAPGRMHDIPKEYGAQKSACLARGVHHARRRPAPSAADRQAQSPSRRQHQVHHSESQARKRNHRNLPMKERHGDQHRRSQRETNRRNPSERAPRAPAQRQPVSQLPSNKIRSHADEKRQRGKQLRRSARSRPRGPSTWETMKNKTSFRSRSSRTPKQSAKASAIGTGAPMGLLRGCARLAFLQSPPAPLLSPWDRPADGCEIGATRQQPTKTRPMPAGGKPRAIRRSARSAQSTPAQALHPGGLLPTPRPGNAPALAQETSAQSRRQCWDTRQPRPARKRIAKRKAARTRATTK